MHKQAIGVRGESSRGGQRTRLGRAVVLAALVLAAGSASPAAAQYVLDRNLQQGSGGINPRQSDLAAEMRFRNSIVTGNAPGGLSFRGDVGYRAPGEFSGRIGSDDTFSFRRDTVYSGLGGMGLRGTDALQYQFALTTGMRPPPGFSGTTASISRTGAASTSGLLRGDAQRLDFGAGSEDFRPRWSPGDTAADVRGLSLSAMRTPSAFTTTRSFQPSVLGVLPGADGQPIGVTASGLRGVSYGPVTTGRELERDPAVVPTPPGLDGQLPQTTEDPAVPPDLSNQRIDLSVGAPRSPYQEMLARLRGPEADEGDDPAGVMRLPGELRDPDEMRAGTWRNRLMDLRLQLQDPVAADRGRIDRRAGEEPAESVEQADERRRRYSGDFDPATVEMLRRAGQIDVLAPEGVDAYALNMNSAQQHLAAGRYFDAEERFTAALSARPGDPMAAIGRVHAELGASMFLSASINLRDLLVANPEVVGVRYGSELLPSPERMRSVKERLIELIATRPAQARENGMLLAYLGYQMRDRQAIERGLGAMGAPMPGNEEPAAAEQQMISLAALLRRVWLEGPEGQSRPAPAQERPAEAPRQTPR